jgi:arabinan endo-1,5-alpha-L-arabinosidase
MVRPAPGRSFALCLAVSAAALCLVTVGCTAPITGTAGGTGGSAGGSVIGRGSTGGATAATGGRGTGGVIAGGATGGAVGQATGGTIGGATGGSTSADGGVRDASPDLLPPSDGGPGSLGGGPVTPSATHFDIGVHDPSMIWDGTRYYMLATGGTLNIRSSTNLTQWTNAGRVLAAAPAWATAAVPGLNGMWAPDVTYFNGTFHVYYAGSTFGSNTSVIGHATNTTLDSTRPGYAWIEDGLVVQTRGTDNYNAIDPNVAFDAAGVPWLSFGSFWSGIKLRKLDLATGKPAPDDPMLYSIASRNGGAIEAPSIISHGGYYYLFVSFDRCCQGVNSTYRTMVGRAAAITGPYVDSAGVAMMQSGGDEIVATSGRYIGPGGGTAWKNGDNYLYVFHYYDGQANGASKLQIRPINFTADNWVTLGDPLFP